jgi:hypothetical protein
VNLVKRLDPAIGFVAERRPDNLGFTNTLTTLLGRFLLELETTCGQRDREYTLLGVEFCEGGPFIWYPFNCGYVSIMLSDGAQQNLSCALFEMAHEVVHVLSPSGTATAPVVEEGLATHYSHMISERFALNQRSRIASYLKAEQALRALLNADDKALWKLRQSRPKFHKWDADFVREVIPSVSRDLASELCAPFVRN